jgi:hypothetical protein
LDRVIVDTTVTHISERRTGYRFTLRTTGESLR